MIKSDKAGAIERLGSKINFETWWSTFFSALCLPDHQTLRKNKIKKKIPARAMEKKMEHGKEWSQWESGVLRTQPHLNGRVNKKTRDYKGRAQVSLKKERLRVQASFYSVITKNKSKITIKVGRVWKLNGKSESSYCENFYTSPFSVHKPKYITKGEYCNTGRHCILNYKKGKNTEDQIFYCMMVSHYLDKGK